MEDQFKKLNPGQDVPEDLKVEVFKTIDTLNLFAEVIDLFTVKFPASKGQMLGATIEHQGTDSLDSGEIAEGERKDPPSEDIGDQK